MERKPKERGISLIIIVCYLLICFFALLVGIGYMYLTYDVELLGKKISEMQDKVYGQESQYMIKTLAEEVRETEKTDNDLKTEVESDSITNETKIENEVKKGIPTGLRYENEEIFMLPFSISATSTLKQNGYNYDASNLNDLDVTTCWAEGVSGNGTNETVLYTDSEAHIIQGLAVFPGYGKSLKLYEYNNVPAKIRIECGGRVINYEFSENAVDFSKENILENLIYIDFGESIESDKCKVTITEVYERECSDCCISEMFLYS